jgi:hypothetical protein
VPVANSASVRRHPRAGLEYHVFTSDRRARVSRRGERTPPEVVLLTVGDSFSWGHGVENEDTYTARLAQRWRIPAANLAFSAYGTVQASQMLQRSLDLKPKLIVYGFIADHMKRNVSPCAPAYGPLCLPVSHIGIDEHGLPVVRPPDPGLFAVNRRFWDEFFFAKTIGPRQVRAALEAEWIRWTQTPEAEAPDDPVTRERILTKLIGDMVRAAGSVGANLLVLNIPYFERGPTPPTPVPLKNALTRLLRPNMIFLDLGPAVDRHYSNPSAPLLRFERDRHPSAAAHALMADAIDASLRERWLLPVPAAP